MAWFQWALVVMLTMGGGWMTYDGVKALTTGDYTTPRSGEHAGELGPWATLVQKAGIEPRSIMMKSVFVVAGLLGLTAALMLGFGLAGGRWIAAVFAACTLWYLPVGSAFSVIELALLAFFWGRLS